MLLCNQQQRFFLSQYQQTDGQGWLGNAKELTIRTA